MMITYMQTKERIRELERKVFSGLLLAVFLIGMLASALSIQPVKASSLRRISQFASPIYPKLFYFPPLFP